MSQRGMMSRSLSVRRGRGLIKRPESAAGGSALPPVQPPRSLTPPGRIEHSGISLPTAGLSGEAESLLRRASTPERGNVSSSSFVPNFLDDTNVSTIPTASTGAISKTSQRSTTRQLLLERKQLKNNKEKKALLAQMQAVYASCQLYEEQEASENSRNQAKIDKLKSEMAKEEALINKYVTCLEMVPLLKEKQAALDREKAKHDEIMKMLRGADSNTGDESFSEEELAEIREGLKNLKTSVDRVKNALIVRKIAFPIDGVEKALKHTANIFERTPDHKQVNRSMKKFSQLITQLEQLVIIMDRKKEMLEEKDRLTVHLASLQTSLMLYKMKVQKKE